jgi:hypothetical protein
VALLTGLATNWSMPASKQAWNVLLEGVGGERDDGDARRAGRRGRGSLGWRRARPSSGIRTSMQIASSTKQPCRHRSLRARRSRDRRWTYEAAQQLDGDELVAVGLSSANSSASAGPAPRARRWPSLRRVDRRRGRARPAASATGRVRRGGRWCRGPVRR